MSRIYLASSWRNMAQPATVLALRGAGHEVYDFRNPRPGDDGFHWSEIDPEWLAWDGASFRAAPAHPIARAGFASDFAALRWAEVGVLLLPCGRSAHLEAGYLAGAGKPLYVLLAEHQEPELMYGLATGLYLGVDELLAALSTAVPS
jgi:hypothetical protein